VTTGAATLSLEFILNGRPCRIEVPAARTLLHLLREDLGLTGTKANCLEAECGVCTVLVDGQAVNACTLLAVAVDGRTVETIEGLAAPGDLHPMQQAFQDLGALQCGFCIPGVIMSAVALVRATPDPDPADVRDALAGNLCRCTGYTRLVQAVLEGARRLRAAADPARASHGRPG
jgi:carbon-monoxide dehydrogenase small subunit